MFPESTEGHAGPPRPDEDQGLLSVRPALMFPAASQQRCASHPDPPQDISCCALLSGAQKRPGGESQFISRHRDKQIIDYCGGHRDKKRRCRCLGCAGSRGAPRLPGGRESRGCAPAEPPSAACTSAGGAGRTCGRAAHNNKIMGCNAHLGTDHTPAAPFLCTGGQPAAPRLARRGGTDAAGGGQGGKEGGNRLIKRIHRGGRLPPTPRPCPRRARSRRERRAPTAAAAAPVPAAGGRAPPPRAAPPPAAAEARSPAWRGAAASSASSAAASRRIRSPRGRPPPPAAALQPAPRPSGAPRSPTGARRRRSSSAEGAAAAAPPRPPGPRRPHRLPAARPRGKCEPSPREATGQGAAGPGVGGQCTAGGQGVLSPAASV